jgi:hypothetical protein
VVSSRSARSVLFCLVAVAVTAPSAEAAPACPISYGSADDAKPNKLYMYYPAASDPTFPEFGAVGGGPTSPATPFDTSLLTSYTGTADDLRNGTNDVVIDDFCEFNVQVRPTTTAPPATFPRRVTIAVGTESEPGGRWGRANLVDTGDPTPLGFARVWAGTYQNSAGFPGGALEGANSTVNRWSRAIGGTAAHEAGHTYGLSHNTTTLPGEDDFGRHLMPAGSDVSQEERAGYRRHFSDTEFSTLASNVGLSIQTMHNWDLVNPNSQTAHQFRMTFLSPQESPVLSWSYAGSRSPWINPTVSTYGTQTFKGTTYNRFRIRWSTADPWSGGPDGQVPGGGEFHVGATFSGVDFNDPDPIIITNSELLDDDGDPLPLKPRLPGYDTGTLDSDDGSFDINFTNFASEFVAIQNVVVRRLPRVLSIEEMVSGGDLRDPFGEPFTALSRPRVVLKESRPLGRKRGVSVRVARMSAERDILEEVDAKCEASDSPVPGDTDGPCKAGFNASLFPSTTFLITADAVAAPTRVYDARRKRFVRKSLTTRIYYQVGGIAPDLNRNRVDDAIDIEFGDSDDDNEDGVPDDAQRRRRR